MGCGAYTRYEEPGEPAIYHVHAHCPLDHPMPFIPMRTATGIETPRGDFDTYCCTPTMELAKETGYTFEVIDGYVFDGFCNPFDAFIGRCETIEVEHKGEPLAAVIKLLRNSAYGKLGERPEREEVVYTDAPTDDMDEYISPRTGEIVDNTYVRPQILHRSYMHVEWAAFVTDHGRANLIRAARAVGFDHVYDGDTDSLYVDRAAYLSAVEDGRLVVGGNYGQFKLEAEFSRIAVGGPKNRVCFYADGRAPKQRHKGIPAGSITPEQQYEAITGGVPAVATFESVTSMKAIQDGETAYSTIRTRTLRGMESSPKLVREGDRMRPRIAFVPPIE